MTAATNTIRTSSSSLKELRTSSFPSSAAFQSRAHPRPTATNIRSGAKTPVCSGIVHASTLFAILLVAAPLAAYIPLATLAGVLFVVAYNMGEWREIGKIIRLSKADVSVWATTFALTVFADLTVAVEVGIVLAALLYIYRVSQTTTVAPVTSDSLEESRPHVLNDKEVPDYVSILRIQGPFLFGTTEKLEEATSEGGPSLKPIVILKLRHMTALDATGLHALERLAHRIKTSRKILNRLWCSSPAGQDAGAIEVRKARRSREPVAAHDRRPPPR